MKEMMMFNYIVAFVGLFILVLIPEYAGMVQVVVQSFIGLGIFAIGTISIIAENN